MNDNEIRQRLQAYRAGSGPTGDPEIDALVARAEQDPQLQAFLEEEARFDAAFAAKVNDIPVPGDLKERILRAADVRATQRNTVPFPAAQAHPAPGEADASENAEPRRRSSWMHAGALAFAALVMIGLALNFTFFRSQPERADAPVSVASLGSGISFQEFLSKVGSFQPEPSNLNRGSGMNELSAILASTGAPVPRQVPQKLSPEQSFACGSLIIDGIAVGMICFRREDNTYHLFSFDRQAVPGAESLQAPEVFESNGHAYAAWATEDQVYVLSSKASAAQLKQML